MTQTVEIVPEIALANWYKEGSGQSVEEQIIEAIINQFTPEHQRAFLSSSLKDIPNPALLKDIEFAVELLLDVISTNQKVLIVGDYDVDGITSTALLIRFFKRIGFSNYDRFIPNRFIHGYGLTSQSVDVILAKEPDLIITVDNGITAREEIDRIQQRGIKVIVTDHHLPQEESLPNCYILNPKQENCPYPCKNLSGVGVVFLFLVAVRAELRKRAFWKDPSEEPNMAEHLDLVALGTIADQVPLLGLNRIFAKFGLSYMTRKSQEGYPGEFYQYLRVFAERAGVRAFTSESIAFNLAPMLNATGRMKEAEEGLDFIMADNEQNAVSRYQYLDRLNQKRRKKQQIMVRKASEYAATMMKRGEGVVVYDSSFHEGLIGVIASRLVDLFRVPCVVVTDSETGVLKASCRSRDDNMMEILHECRDHLIQFGGHANAAGCSLEKETLDAFRARFTEVLVTQFPLSTKRVVKANIEVTQEMLTFTLLDKLKVFEPYGQENRKPVFMMRNVMLPIPNVLTGKHLKWILERDLELIYWNGADSVEHASTYDIAFTVGENTFRGETKRQLIVKSILTAKAE